MLSEDQLKQDQWMVLWLTLGHSSNINLTQRIFWLCIWDMVKTIRAHVLDLLLILLTTKPHNSKHRCSSKILHTWVLICRSNSQIFSWKNAMLESNLFSCHQPISHPSLKLHSNRPTSCNNKSSLLTTSRITQSLICRHKLTKLKLLHLLLSTMPKPKLMRQ